MVVPDNDGHEVVVLVGAEGAHLLMEVPAAGRGAIDFRRRMGATNGVHVVMMADEATNRGEGTVYGFFECHQPLPGRPTPARPRGGKAAKGRF